MQHQRISILLLEDELAYAELVRLVLAEVCPEVFLTHAQNGIAALAYLRQADVLRPSLILADIKMPKMDGLSFLQIVKADDYLREIPVLMLSASEELEDIHACYYNYAAGYIVKEGDLYAFSKKMSGMIEYWLNVATLPKQR